MMSSSESQIPSPSVSTQTGLPSTRCAPRASASARYAGSTGIRKPRLGALRADWVAGALPFSIEKVRPEIEYVWGPGGAIEFRIENVGPEIAYVWGPGGGVEFRIEKGIPVIV